MDRETRSRIQRATQTARELLEHEYAEQLEGFFDIRLDGTVAAGLGEHLDAAQRVLREKLVTAVEHQCAGGMAKADAVGTYLQEAAFTTLNRFVALKMLEARAFVKECISRADHSTGFKEFSGLAPGLVQLPDRGYRIYIESAFDEIGREVRVLFDRRDTASLLWPRWQALFALLRILNSGELDSAWAEDETLGWVYQYFNRDDERRKMRARSQAPRNSGELAVRNQFFTPRYVVRFLTDNTLGRIWYEMRQGDTQLTALDYLSCRSNEIFLDEGVCLPDELDGTDEQFRSEEGFQHPLHVPFRPKKDPRDIRVLDPACGSGHFLLYAFDLFVAIYEEAWADEAAPKSNLTGNTLREDFPDLDSLHGAVAALILRHNLYGIDIDARCAQIAALSLWMRAQRGSKDPVGIPRLVSPAIQRTNIVVAEPMPGEVELRREFIATLGPRLGSLMSRLFERMELAGEVGFLLRLEDDIRDAVREIYGEHGSLFRASDQHRWLEAEREMLRALSAYTDRVVDGRAFRRRLFADDAEQGFGLIELCTQRYDVILMNPPFGLGTKRTKSLLKRLYPDTWTDLYSAFVSRTLELLSPGAALGAITSNLWLSIKRQVSLRALVSGPKRLRIVADLGGGVLDDATVNTSLSVIDNVPSCPAHTVAFYICRDPDLREKVLAETPQSFVRLSRFAKIPATPFCFYLGHERLLLWSKLAERLDPHLALTYIGNSTFDNFRFLRAHWEVPAETFGTGWMRYDKGGFFQPFFNPSVLVWRFENRAAENRAFQISSYGTDAQVAQSSKHWGKGGLCYSRATSIGFSPRVLAGEHVVNDKSIAVIPNQKAQGMAILALLSSTSIQDLLLAFGYHRSIEKGAVASLPVGRSTFREHSAHLADLALRAFRAMWRLEATVETSPVFLRPALNDERVCEIQCVLGSLKRIDVLVSRLLYRDRDIAPLSIPKTVLVEKALIGRFGEGGCLMERLSYGVGVVFGRWNFSRLWDELDTVVPDDPFGALPERQPGTDGRIDLVTPRRIAHLDEGHEADLVALLKDAVGELVDDPGGSPEIRELLTDNFFAEHIASYSQSGRSAPIYWQIAPTSASYSVWLYYERLDGDTFYTVLNDYVSPKLEHEERTLRRLVRDAGSNPTTGQRSESDIQQGFIAGLRVFRDEVAMIAPLWKPNREDGVIINFAPLWRLVPQNRAWQKECKTIWEAVVAGDYDWAHLAMHVNIRSTGVGGLDTSGTVW